LKLGISSHTHEEREHKHYKGVEVGIFEVKGEHISAETIIAKWALDIGRRGGVHHHVGTSCQKQNHLSEIKFVWGKSMRPQNERKKRKVGVAQVCSGRENRVKPYFKQD